MTASNGVATTPVTDTTEEAETKTGDTTLADILNQLQKLNEAIVTANSALAAIAKGTYPGGKIS